MKILIAVPTFENICPETFKSIYDLKVPDGAICSFDFVKGYDCARARNEIAKKDFDYVLMVDSDIVVPSDALEKLLAVNVEVCLGVYPRKNTRTGETELFAPNQKDFINVYNINHLPNKPMLVKGGGLGCALIEKDVFERLEYPWFRYVIYPNDAVLSEDNYFCGTVGKVFAEPTVRCGHVGKQIQWR